VVTKRVDLAAGTFIGGPEIVAQVAMTLPIIVVQGGSRETFCQALGDHLEAWPSLASCSTAFRDFPSPIVVRGESHFERRLGEANAPRWDGTHEGFPLFAGPVVS
jgi:hypothetical protein